MKKLLLVLLCVALYLLEAGCKKEDYSVGKSPFNIGDKVKLDGIDPRKSFVPYDCCTCPCTIDKAYTTPNEIYWYYDLHDIHNTPLMHVDNKQLKKY